MNVFVVLSALVVVALASDDYAAPAYGKGPSYGGAHVYHGKYPGKCGNDGLYFKNEKSFVFCSNGNSYVQPCAPGTRNSAYGKYNYGKEYSHRDFCDVNLLSEGYAPKAPAHPKKEYVEEKPAYPEPVKADYVPEKSYGEPKYDYGYGPAYGRYGYDNRYYGYGYPNYGFGYYGHPY